jgi:arylsulfatase A-like enzyme
VTREDLFLPLPLGEGIGNGRSPSAGRKRFRLRVVLLALGLLAACSRTPPPNIVIVVFDALRADRVGCYGNTGGLTPYIDELAARATVFRRAYAPAPWTNPSVASLLTSRFQSQHGITSFESVLAESEVTLPEILGPHRYVSGAFSANGVIGKQRGFGQGYDEYQAILPPKAEGPRANWLPLRGEVVNRMTLRWLDGLPRTPSRPLYLYVQYMETHSPYAPPEDLMERFFAGRPRPNLEEANSRFFLGNIVPIEPELADVIRTLYDAQVATTDRHVRDLFAALEQRGILRNAIVILTADHGEEFGEHGFFAHKASLYEPALRVPLIIAVPGQTHGRVIDDLVSLIDVAPTILDWIGMPAPDSFEGRSLTPHLPPPSDGGLASLRRWWSGNEWRSAPAYVELVRPAQDKRPSPHERAVILDQHKLIAGVDGEREFFDLHADPGETQSSALGAEDRTALEAALQHHVKHAAGAAAPRELKAMDAETRERLRALGYD